MDICALAQQLEPQSANKVIRRILVKDAGLTFPEPYVFEDIFFHTLAIAKAKRITFLDVPTFTYFRRYQRPQITETTGIRRFDIIAVVQLTLSHFSALPEFQNEHYRACVVASCMKLVNWCEVSISHSDRALFRQSLHEMLEGVKADFPREF
jgi:hypothetical protein